MIHMRITGMFLAVFILISCTLSCASLQTAHDIHPNKILVLLRFYDAESKPITGVHVLGIETQVATVSDDRGRVRFYLSRKDVREMSALQLKFSASGFADSFTSLSISPETSCILHSVRMKSFQHILLDALHLARLGYPEQSYNAISQIDSDQLLEGDEPIELIFFKALFLHLSGRSREAIDMLSVSEELSEASKELLSQIGSQVRQ